MATLSSTQRALAFACAIALVVLVAQLALARFDWSRADALAIDAMASGVVLALAAAAIAAFASEPLRVRLALAASRLGWGRIALAAAGLVGLSHAAEGAVRIAGLSDAALLRFDDALRGLALPEIALPLLGLGLASACGEEIFFRGLLQRGLVPRIGTPAAIGVAALAFGAAHGDWTHGVAAAGLGVYLGAVAALAGSIRPAIAAHAANNAVALVEKVAGIELPSGRLAAVAAVACGTTLAGVALVALARARRPRATVQFPGGSVDERSGP